MPGTKFFIQRRCMQCGHVCDVSLSHCPECGFLFIGEATELERVDWMEDMIKRQRIAEANK
jgi:ribosomal protein L37E